MKEPISQAELDRTAAIVRGRARFFGLTTDASNELVQKVMLVITHRYPEARGEDLANLAREVARRVIPRLFRDYTRWAKHSRAVIDHLRAKSSREQRSDDEVHSQLRSSLASLSDEERDLLYHRFGQGLKYRQIDHLLNDGPAKDSAKRIAKLKTKVSRAIEKLNKELRRRGFDTG